MKYGADNASLTGDAAFHGSGSPAVRARTTSRARERQIRIINAGLSVVTDLGRFGSTHLGIQVNGAADQRSARTANILVGNREDAPLFEITAVFPFSFRVEDHMLVAVTGAATSMTVDGVPLPVRTPFVAWPGSVVQIAAVRRGLRSYAAIHGLIEGDSFHGSVAFDPLIGRGRRLHDDDEVAVIGPQVHAPPHGSPSFAITAESTSYPQHWRLGMLSGPEAEEFPGIFDATQGLKSLGDLQVGTQSDHIGVRLEGHSLVRTIGDEILSRGVPVGAVEIPPTGGMIMLLRGRPLTAGYPVPAVVARGWHHLLGQIRPGDRVTLVPTTPAQSLATVYRQREALNLLRARCRTAFTASGTLPRETATP
ncbi:MAG TPA: allophanate hydrolase [Brevibacterium senegalense]|uniref:Allophanate hydrolase n=1 Tax=Brevibacterium senegalense TaxID=1033736 RepID=A0A921MFM7_9MICO|nr:allophanate hydrolase [Brevibacterium senegalense]